MARKISGMERRVWDLHCAGFSISQISSMTSLDGSFVRATINSIWHGGGMVS